MELTPPPFFEHLFLESPWPLVCMLLALAIGLLIVALRRVSVKHLIAAGLCLPLSLSIILLAWTVKTNREVVTELTEQLVHDTEPLQMEKIKSLLDPNVRLLGSDNQLWLSGDELFRKLSTMLERYKRIHHTILQIQAQTDQSPFARTLIDLKSEYAVDLNVIPSRTRWLLTWERSAKGEYHVVEIRWLEFQNAASPRFLE